MRWRECEVLRQVKSAPARRLLSDFVRARIPQGLEVSSFRVPSFRHGPTVQLHGAIKTSRGDACKLAQPFAIGLHEMSCVYTPPHVSWLVCAIGLLATTAHGALLSAFVHPWQSLAFVTWFAVGKREGSGGSHIPTFSQP